MRTRTLRGPLALAATAAFLVGLVVVSVAAPAGAAPTKGPGEFSQPEWLPLRRDVDGGEITVGCTHRSQGSQNGYSCGGHHDYWAIDFIAGAGTPVYAAGRGFATNATGQSGASGYGNVVRIDHGGGTGSVYAHLQAVLLPPEGAWVDEETVIGLVGSTGTSSAPHLHFERRQAGVGSADLASGGGGEQVDPGPLKACVLTKVVAYPGIRNEPTWDGLAWGTFTVFSEGTTCDVPLAVPATAVIPHRPVEALRDRIPASSLLEALAQLAAVDHG